VNSKGKTLVVMGTVIGALLPLRPLLFTKPTDPTAETIDLFLSPLYVVGPMLPPLGDAGSLAFLLLAMVVNATLYGLLVRYLVYTFVNPPPNK